ncbi:MAG: hypothetical protein ACFHX7_07900 [Pseudomonadota bacterium]
MFDRVELLRVQSLMSYFAIVTLNIGVLKRISLTCTTRVKSTGQMSLVGLGSHGTSVFADLGRRFLIDA